MANDTETGVKIGGDATGAVEAMNKAAQAVSSGVNSMKSSFDGIAGSFTKITGLFIGLAAVVGGGKMFADAIDSTNQLTGEAVKLSRTLGITVGEASALNTALGDIYSDSDTYIGAFQKFASQLKRNEEGFREMGLQTRDASGNLRNANDVFREGIELVGKYKPGLDQNTAAQKLFGKSVEDVMKLQKLNNELIDAAIEKNEQLGLTITEGNVQASKEYKAAMNDVGDVMTAVQKTIGDAVMPAFTELATYFAEVGPYAINILKGALTGLMLVFRSVQAVVKTVAAVVFETINHLMDQLGNLSDLISSVLSGDFEGAAQAAKNLQDRWVQSFTNIKDAAVDAFTTASESFGKDSDTLWGAKTPAAGTAARGGSRTMSETDLAGKDKGKAEKSNNLAKVEADLAATKLFYAQTNDLREMSKAQELETYQELLTKYDLTEKEKATSAKKVSEMRLAVLRDERQQQIELATMAAQAEQAAGLAGLEQQRSAAQFKVQTQQMTNEELIALEVELENQRNEILKQGVAARLAILEQDPTKNAVALAKLNEELAEIERTHALAQQENMQASQAEQLKDWQGLFNQIGQNFGQTVIGLAKGTMTIGQAVKGLFQSVLSSVGNFIAQIIAKKIAAYAIEKTMATGTIAMNAAEAGSGAAASQASIPYVGPILAIAAMAAIFAAVSGMKGNVASAEGGFDIPAGLNPMTQLHEKEMVLPQAEADTIRSLKGADQAPIIIPTTGGDFIHKDQLAGLLKKLNRNFEFK